MLAMTGRRGEKILNRRERATEKFPELPESPAHNVQVHKPRSV
jgi:hypothetical protein